MILRKTFAIMLCGIVFGLAALPAFAQAASESSIDEFRTRLKRAVNAGVDIRAPFAVNGTVTIDRNERRSKIDFTKSEGSADVPGLAKGFVEAIFVSQYKTLTEIAESEIVFGISQDRELFRGSVLLEQINEKRAILISTVFRLFFESFGSDLGKRVAKLESDDPNSPELPRFRDQIELYKTFKVTAEGKKVIIEFAMPADAFHKMVERWLAQPDKTNG